MKQTYKDIKDLNYYLEISSKKYENSLIRFEYSDCSMSDFYKVAKIVEGLKSNGYKHSMTNITKDGILNLIVQK